MKVVILCGGKGTRLREETEFKPKPLVLVGHQPVIWHIMKIYAHHGFNEFVLTLGYKGSMIKDYFLHQQTYQSDFTLETKHHKITFHNNQCDDFKVTFVETEQESLTGERVRRIKDHITEDHFMLTYGDGVADINIKALLEFHQKQGTIATLTGVKPLTRFGVVEADRETRRVTCFHQSGIVSQSEQAQKMSELPPGHINDYINGGFMVFNRKVFDYLKPDSMIEEIFVPLAEAGQLSLYDHSGQWKCMDTYRDVEELNGLWQKDPFWKVW